MRSAVKENDMWIKAQVHEETTKSSNLETGRQLGGEGQGSTGGKMDWETGESEQRRSEVLHKKIAKTQRDEWIRYSCLCWLNTKQFPV